MTDKLPPQLLALFAPRPPLRWVAPADYPAQERRTAAISGVAAFLPALASYKDQDGFKPTESWLERKDRIAVEKKEALVKRETEGPVGYEPQSDPQIKGDAFKTLIVSRLSYEADEKDLEREFGRIGSIERIRIVTDTHAHEKVNKKKKAHRGYAFIVFEREKDMRAAMEQLDGISIKGRRVKLDVERGRTVKGWKPRRLGGGLGGRGYIKAALMRPGGMAPYQNGGGGFQPGGGFRGGRGGFRGGMDRGGGGGGFRGGFDRGPRGGGFAPRNDRGFGGQSNGYGGGAPANAPGGPSFSRGGGYGDRSDRRDQNGSANGDRGGYDRPRGGYDDRSGGGGGGGYRNGTDRSGSNNEPLGARSGGGGGGGGYRDRDYRPREDDSRKRPYDGGGSNYEEQRKLRRY